jgi:hypothetical protein
MDVVLGHKQSLALIRPVEEDIAKPGALDSNFLLLCGSCALGAGIPSSHRDELTFFQPCWAEERSFTHICAASRFSAALAIQYGFASQILPSFSLTRDSESACSSGGRISMEFLRLNLVSSMTLIQSFPLTVATTTYSFAVPPDPFSILEFTTQRSISSGSYGRLKPLSSHTLPTAEPVLMVTPLPSIVCTLHRRATILTYVFSNHEECGRLWEIKRQQRNNVSLALLDCPLGQIVKIACGDHHFMALSGMLVQYHLLNDLPNLIRYL